MKTAEENNLISPDQIKQEINQLVSSVFDNGNAEELHKILVSKNAKYPNGMLAQISASIEDQLKLYDEMNLQSDKAELEKVRAFVGNFKEGLEKASAGGFAANYQVSGLVGELSQGLTDQGERGFFSKIYSAFKSVFSSPDKASIQQDQDRFTNFADRMKNSVATQRALENLGPEMFKNIKEPLIVAEKKPLVTKAEVREEVQQPSTVENPKPEVSAQNNTSPGQAPPPPPSGAAPNLTRAVDTSPKKDVPPPPSGAAPNLTRAVDASPKKDVPPPPPAPPGLAPNLTGAVDASPKKDVPPPPPAPPGVAPNLTGAAVDASLKKDVPPAPGRVDLLSEIQKGTTLKNVSKDESDTKKNLESDESDVWNSLKNAVIAKKEDPEAVKDNDSTQDWEDDDDYKEKLDKEIAQARQKKAEADAEDRSRAEEAARVKDVVAQTAPAQSNETKKDAPEKIEAQKKASEVSKQLQGNVSKGGNLLDEIKNRKAGNAMSSADIDAQLSGEKLKLSSSEIDANSKLASGEFQYIPSEAPKIKHIPTASLAGMRGIIGGAKDQVEKAFNNKSETEKLNILYSAIIDGKNEFVSHVVSEDMISSDKLEQIGKAALELASDETKLPKQKRKAIKESVQNLADELFVEIKLNKMEKPGR